MVNILNYRLRQAVLTIFALISVISVFTLGVVNVGAQTALQSQTKELERGSPRWRNQLRGLVVVGDSLSAGFQNGSLLDRQQRNGYASLVARQARSSLSLPLVAEPGIPNVLTLVNPGPPPIISPAPGVSPGRLNSFLPVTNLAVPGATVQDALATRPNFPLDSLTDLVLGLPWLYLGVSNSQVELAQKLRPKTLIVWIGNNDALGAALAGNASVTPLPQFQTAYAEVLNRLDATNAQLIIANIPDVTTIPYLTSSEEIAANAGLPIEVIGPLLGITTGDFVTPDAIPLVSQILSNQIPGPLPPNVVLNSAEVATIRTAINSYNSFIATQAAEKGAVLVDVNALTNNLNSNGYPLGDGLILTTNFLGGIFSLDGVHPTNTGYAIIANEFIGAINRRLGKRIPFVNVALVANADPLVPKNTKVKALTNLPNEAVINLQLLHNQKIWETTGNN